MKITEPKWKSYVVETIGPIFTWVIPKFVAWGIASLANNPNPLTFEVLMVNESGKGLYI